MGSQSSLVKHPLRRGLKRGIRILKDKTKDSDYYTKEWVEKFKGSLKDLGNVIYEKGEFKVL